MTVEEMLEIEMAKVKALNKFWEKLYESFKLKEEEVDDGRASYGTEAERD